jgi:predicted nucleotidyltransferase
VAASQAAVNTFEIVNEIANTKRLSFLIIGGHAVNAYGYSRFTEDLDVLINKEEKSTWLTALEAQGFSLYNDGGTFLQMTPPSGADPLDLMLVTPETFTKLNEGNKTVEICGLQMRVPSLESLFALKLHVLKQEVPNRSYKDLMDILSLAECNEVDLHSDKFRNLCEKFGSRKIYERILAFQG